MREREAKRGVGGNRATMKKGGREVDRELRRMNEEYAELKSSYYTNSNIGTAVLR